MDEPRVWIAASGRARVSVNIWHGLTPWRRLVAWLLWRASGLAFRARRLAIPESWRFYSGWRWRIHWLTGRPFCWLQDLHDAYVRNARHA